MTIDNLIESLKILKTQVPNAICRVINPDNDEPFQPITGFTYDYNFIDFYSDID